MRGYPKSLNTKNDYLYVIENFPKEKWIGDIQGLLDSAYDWFFEKDINEADSGIEDDTHKVVISENDGKETKSQYVKKLNPLCKMIRLGFTEDEIRRIISNE